MKKIRFGIIGSNVITDSFIKGLVKVKEGELTAVYSRTEERAKAFAAQYEVPYTFTNLEEMATSNVIDAVYIASPNALHASQTILFLNHKKHVLCEKAFASNANEVKAMIEAAKRNQVILMEGIKNIHVPNFKTVSKQLELVGTVRKYFASFCQYSSRYDAYKEGEVLNAFKPELSNGALVDIGVYCIAPMVHLFGAPSSIKATGMMLESGVDGEGSILFGYPHMTATVIYSKISDSTLPSEIQGEKGTIRIEKISQFKEVSFIPRKGEAMPLGIIDKTEDLYDEIQSFVNLIREDNKEQANVWLEKSLLVVEIMDEVRRQIGIIYPADIFTC